MESPGICLLGFGRPAAGTVPFLTVFAVQSGLVHVCVNMCLRGEGCVSRVFCVCGFFERLCVCSAFVCGYRVWSYAFQWPGVCVHVGAPAVL